MIKSSSTFKILDCHFVIHAVFLRPQVKEKKLTNLDEATIRDIVGELEEDEAKAKASTAKGKGKDAAKGRQKKNKKTSETQHENQDDDGDDDGDDALQTFAKGTRGKEKKR